MQLAFQFIVSKFIPTDLASYSYSKETARLALIHSSDFSAYKKLHTLGYNAICEVIGKWEDTVYPRSLPSSHYTRLTFVQDSESNERLQEVTFEFAVRSVVINLAWTLRYASYQSVRTDVTIIIIFCIKVFEWHALCPVTCAVTCSNLAAWIILTTAQEILRGNIFNT
jgi:hypothetical protein